MLTTLHTKYQFGSYLADRTDMLKLRENRELKNSPTNPTFLKPLFDGKDSLALGYEWNRVIGIGSGFAILTIFWRLF